MRQGPRKENYVRQLSSLSLGRSSSPAPFTRGQTFHTVKPAEKNIPWLPKWTEARHTLLPHGPGLDTEQGASVCLSVCLSVCVPSCGEADTLDRLRDWVPEGPLGKRKSQ